MASGGCVTQSTLYDLPEEAYEVLAHVVGDLLLARLDSHPDVQRALLRQPGAQADDERALRQRLLAWKLRGSTGRRPSHQKELLALGFSARDLLILDAIQIR